MIASNKLLVEVLREEYGLHLVKCNEKEFELLTYKDVPVEIGQLASTMSYSGNYAQVNAIGRLDVVDIISSPTTSLIFLASAEGQLTVLLSSLLEKKRFKEFSKTFDKEVESELDKR